MTKLPAKWLIAAVVIAAGGVLAWQYWQGEQAKLPEGIVSGNGRIEADQTDIATKYAGRVETVQVKEGDLVDVGQVVATMDVRDIRAHRERAEAQLAEAHEAVQEARAGLAKSQSDLEFREAEYARALSLVETGAMSQRATDQRKMARDAARSGVSAALARLRTLEKGVEAYEAGLKEIDTQLEDSTLVSTIQGRVLYRLAEPGEVIGAGGKIVTLVNLQEIYFEMFLAADQVRLISLGSDARIVIDGLDFAIPATVSFVSPEAQFTPKQVETLEERQKLMFRVKLRIPNELVQAHIEQVKTGVRGTGYVRLGSNPPPWPDFLERRFEDTATIAAE